MLTRGKVLAARIFAFFRGSRLDRDLEEEMESHLALLAEDNLRRGMTPAQARREARIRLGGLASTQELHREARGLPFLDTLGQDLRASGSAPAPRSSAW